MDAIDWEWLSKFSWNPFPDNHTCYASTGMRLPNGEWETTVLMHRLIQGCRRGDGKRVDHIDGNGLHNWRGNLRECSASQNSCNRRKRRGCKSRFKGVHKKKHKWRARIQIAGKRRLIGDFADEVEAALAYDAKAKELHGEFACLNFPEANSASSRQAAPQVAVA